MTTSQPYYNVNFTATIGNPTVNRQVDGSGIALMAGTHGQVLVGETRGKYFEVTKRSQSFFGSTLIAGVALPVNAASLVSKFTLWNPVGSGYDVELNEFSAGLTTGVEVVGSVLIGFQSKVSSSGGSPTSLTALSPLAGYVSGGGNNRATLYSAATLTNAAVLPTYNLGMSFESTSGPMNGNGVYVFDGKFILPPDTIATFISNVAAEALLSCSLGWTEWPV